MRLSTRYFAVFAGLATTGFIAFAVVNAVANYRENVSRLTHIQQTEGKVIATRVDAYMASITRQLHEVNALPWSDGLDAADELAELHRLLKLVPAIYEVHSLDRDGRERARASRTALDLPHARIDQAPVTEDSEASGGTSYSAAYFHEGSTPFVSVRVTDGAGELTHVLVADVSLRYVADLVAQARFGAAGEAYVVDSARRLVAHPNLSLVHQNRNLSSLPQVQAAYGAAGGAGAVTSVAHSIDGGGEVLTSSVDIPGLGWKLFVEQPVDEFMSPVRDSLARSFWLLVILLVAGLLASHWAAQRLTRPIVRLGRGAARIGLGQLTVRIPETGSDELCSLAREFNHMAERLEQSYASLEEKVRIRTHDLATATQSLRIQAEQVASLNAQLKEKMAQLAGRKEEAERANAAKTRFLAAASHDLRQPLQAISLMVDVLRERVVQKDARALVDKVQLSVLSMERLFVSLLDISRLDAGAVHPRVVEFRVSTLLRLVEANFLPQAAAKGLRLTVVDSNATIRTDPALLERMLANLVSNAIRYTSAGRIVIGCRRRDGDLCIEVVDTGPGIPAELHGDIFEEFFQVPGTLHDRGQGLGLGLSIVKRTADILGHRLVLRSTPGRGSTFGIRVPLVSTARVKDAALSEARADSAALAGLFVLVLDDDAQNCFAIEGICSQWGCHVLAGTSLEEVLGKLDAHLRSPDLVITDYRLGGERTGIDAIGAIRGKLEEPIPAIVMTGDLAVREPDVACEARVTLAYKPINADAMREAVCDILGVARTQRVRAA